MRNIFLIAALTLVSLVSPTGTGASRSQTGLLTPGSAQTMDPTPVYSIVYTAMGEGFSDVTDAYGNRTVKNRKVVMAGSAIWRTYAAGGFDTVPFNLTVTDDFDEVVTTPCVGQGGSDRNHNTWSITDPSRYTGGPNTGIIINAPLQRPDGSWYMLDPLVSIYNAMLFTYRHVNDYIRCGGETGADSISWQAGDYIGLMLPGTLEGDAQGKVFTKTTQFVSMADPPLTVQWNVTVRVLNGRDLTVDRLEITQGLQDETNTIPLVQGRRTVVRAYLGIGQDPVPVPFVTGKLSGYVGSTLLGSVPAFNPGGDIVAPVDPNWQQIDHTLNFELPYAWTLQPTLRLEVEVNPDHSVAELNYSNNKLSTRMTFLPCGGVSVTYLSIHYTPPEGFSPADPSPNINVGAEFMRKIYPIPDKGLAYFPRRDVPLTQSINITGTDDLVLAGLSAELLSSSAPRAGHIYAWLPSLAYNGNGLGLLPGVAAFGNDTESPNRWRRIFAHEIGHNYDLSHFNMTTAGRHWFDVYDRVIKPVPASVGVHTITLTATDSGGLKSTASIQITVVQPTPIKHQFLPMIKR
jgi:hypothetical protein